MSNVKIVFTEGDEVRALRGVIDHEDERFIFLKRENGLVRINKNFIIKIEEGNSV
jgi:hypothetical protein